MRLKETESAEQQQASRQRPSVGQSLKHAHWLAQHGAKPTASIWQHEYSDSKFSPSIFLRSLADSNAES